MRHFSLARAARRSSIAPNTAAVNLRSSQQCAASPLADPAVERVSAAPVQRTPERGSSRLLDHTTDQLDDTTDLLDDTTDLLDDTTVRNKDAADDANATELPGDGVFPADCEEVNIEVSKPTLLIYDFRQRLQNIDRPGMLTQVNHTPAGLLYATQDNTPHPLRRISKLNPSTTWREYRRRPLRLRKYPRGAFPKPPCALLGLPLFRMKKGPATINRPRVCVILRAGRYTPVRSRFSHASPHRVQ